MAEEVPSKQPENSKNPEVEATRTTIDKLLDMLKARGKTELNAASIALNMDPRIIENWAKVLENGNLIKISYEVGRMYLEPLMLAPEQQAGVKAKTNITKFILEEDLAVERISIEKFAKNIEDLNTTIGNIEKLYQAKMPRVQKILSDVDRAYAPIEQKKKIMEQIKSDSTKEIEDISKRVDALYSKLNAYSKAQVDSEIAKKLAKVNEIITNATAAQKSIEDTKKTKNKFFDSLNNEVDLQVKQLKIQIKTSSVEIDKELNENSKSLSETTKSLKDQVLTAKQLSSQVSALKKEYDISKQKLDHINSVFTDRYDRMRQEIENDFKIAEQKSKSITNDITLMKENFGGVVKLDEDIRRWEKNMSELSKDVTTTKAEITRLISQLNTIESNKGISVEKRSDAVDNISKENSKLKEKVSHIKKVIKETADQIMERSEGGQ